MTEPNAMGPALEDVVVELLARMLVNDLRQRNAAELQASAESMVVPPPGNDHGPAGSPSIQHQAHDRADPDAVRGLS